MLDDQDSSTGSETSNSGGMITGIDIHWGMKKDMVHIHY